MLGLDHVYHMDSALNNPPDNNMWLRALEAKFGPRETSFSREDCDQFLGHCQVIPTSALYNRPELS